MFEFYETASQSSFVIRYGVPVLLLYFIVTWWTIARRKRKEKINK